MCALALSSSPILIHLHPLFMQAFIILGLAVSGKLQSSKHMHMHIHARDILSIGHSSLENVVCLYLHHVYERALTFTLVK